MALASTTQNTQDPNNPSSNGGFLQRQMNVYGVPKRPGSGQPNGNTGINPNSGQPPQPQQPSGPQPAFMPNGQPQPQPTPLNQQPQGQAGNAGSVNDKGVYTAGQGPTYQYQQQQIGQYQAPQFNQLQNTQNNQLQQLIAGGGSLNPQVVNQMKGAQKDTAALLMKQNLGQQQAALASRGIAPNQGYGLAQQGALQSQMNSDLLGAYRGIDIQAAQTNQNDLLNAISGGSAFTNSATTQAGQNYQTQLQGQQAAGQEQQNFLNSNQQNFQNQQAMLAQQAQTQQGAIGQENQASQFGKSFGLQQQTQDWTQAVDTRNFNQSQANHDAEVLAQRYAAADAYNQQQQSQYNGLLSYLLQTTGGQ